MIADGECGGGDLSWWLAHKSTYKTVGGCFNGYQGAYTFFNVTLRVLDNKGPKYNILEMPDHRHHQREPGDVRQAGPAADLAGRGRRPGDRVVRRHLPRQVLHRHRGGRAS